MTPENKDKMRNDPENYKWGILYFNRNDNRIIVPKRIPGMGWTLNFAHPVSWLIIIGIISFAVYMGRMGNR